MSKASDYQTWFAQAMAAVEFDSDDANAQENLHQLQDQLHGDEPAVVLGGGSTACLHVFSDSSCFCCCCLRQLHDLSEVITRHA
ncbi:MAG: hypothetical protein ABSF66_06570 [Terriglobales bacterium]|jgi:hypothetical protein